MFNIVNRLNVALNSSREGVQEISNIMTREIPKEIEGMTGLGVEVLNDTYFFSNVHFSENNHFLISIASYI